jgi:hypothetical protein
MFPIGIGEARARQAWARAWARPDRFFIFFLIKKQTRVSVSEN